MTLKEAFGKELGRGAHVTYVTEDAHCHVCGKMDMLRAGVCFECKEKVATDMKEVWELGHPKNRWPYRWIDGEPVECTKEDAAAVQEFFDGHQPS